MTASPVWLPWLSIMNSVRIFLSEISFLTQPNEKTRRKWRCPLACRKIKECSCKQECSPSEYGRVIYTKPSDDPRIFTPVPRGTKAFKDIFKTRTCSERVNNRVLNDYKVEHMQTRGKKRYSFFTMIACILIHLDARLKKQKMERAA